MNLNRSGGMHAVFRLPKPGDEVSEGVDVDRLFIRGQPREVDFVLTPAVREGTLIVDAKTHTPIEHRTGELIETFSNYVELRDDNYVPLRI